VSIALSKCDDDVDDDVTANTLFENVSTLRYILKGVINQSDIYGGAIRSLNIRNMC
jgi:hypothetical protein